MIKAYQWLQSQSPQIRELATTPDILISLYQKAQLQGKDALERPQLQNFKNELRSLAGMMGEFDTTDGVPTGSIPTANSSLAVSSQTVNANTAVAASSAPTSSNPPSVSAPISSASTSAAAASAASSEVSSSANRVNSNTSTSANAAGATSSLAAMAQIAAMDRMTLPPQDQNRIGHFVLDSKSLEWLEEIQRELNLESTSEALRLALSVGYGRLSELFPRRR